MTSANDPALPKLTRQLWRHEGLRLKPYRDTVGKLTIGIGRNLDDRGITQPEALDLLRNDIMSARLDARSNFRFFVELNAARQDVITNMVFNLGVSGFAGFTKMIGGLIDGDYEIAAKEMLDSKWARQVGAFPPRAGWPYGGRAFELAEIMRTGTYPEGMA